MGTLKPPHTPPTYTWSRICTFDVHEYPKAVDGGGACVDANQLSGRLTLFLKWMFLWSTTIPGVGAALSADTLLTSADTLLVHVARE